MLTAAGITRVVNAATLGEDASGRVRVLARQCERPSRLFDASSARRRAVATGMPPVGCQARLLASRAAGSGLETSVSDAARPQLVPWLPSYSVSVVKPTVGSILHGNADAACALCIAVGHLAAWSVVAAPVAVFARQMALWHVCVAWRTPRTPPLEAATPA